MVKLLDNNKEKSASGGVYLWYGENQSLLSFELDRWREEFKKRHPQAALIDLQYKKSDEVDLAREFNQAIYGGGLFVQEKLIIIRGFLQAASSGELMEIIKKIVNDVPVGIYLLLAEGEKISWSKGLPAVLQKLIIDAKITAREFNFLPGPELEKWVIEKAKKLGGVMSNSVARLLLMMVGENYWQLHNEVGKLVAYVKNRAVTSDDVNLLVTTVVQDNAFAFTDAIARRDYQQALTVLKKQLELGATPQSLLGMLTWQIRSLVLVREQLDQIKTKPSAREISEVTGLHSFVVTKALQQIPYYSRERLVWIYGELMDLDLKLKTSSQDPAVLFTIFLGKMGSEKK
ncbi:MAG: DNA polymerase III subunit delta [Patescibacteria group bacterium]|mgnify:CR=1 FL=1